MQTDIAASDPTFLCELVVELITRVPMAKLVVLQGLKVTAASPDREVDSQDWCTCTHCVPMPTVNERVWCGFLPQNCMSRRPESYITIQFSPTCSFAFLQSIASGELRISFITVRKISVICQSYYVG